MDHNFNNQKDLKDKMHSEDIIQDISLKTLKNPVETKDIYRSNPNSNENG